MCSYGSRQVNVLPIFHTVQRINNALTNGDGRRRQTEHGFWVAGSNLTTLYKNHFLSKVELPHVDPQKYSRWVLRNWNRELVTRRPVSFLSLFGNNTS